MLSDEEKKALYRISLRRKGIPPNGGFIADNEEITIILNLIEKQSKEIEELKTQIDEHVYYDLGGRSCGKTELLRHYKKGYDMNNKFWKDKIKAKIEEVDYKMIAHQDVREAVKQVLQSLLEKE